MIDIVICTLKLNRELINNISQLRHNIIIVAKDKDKLKLPKNVKVIRDKGKGLATARNLSLKHCKHKYTMMLGDDNIVTNEEIDKAISYLKNYGLVGVGLKTRSMITRSYIQRAIDYRWQTKFNIGICNVIGTPTIHITEILKKFKYNENNQDSDDAELCERLIKAGYNVGYSNATCFDTTIETYKTVSARYKRYGKSDYEYYKTHSKSWTFKRKIRSLLHPFYAESDLLKSEFWPIGLYCIMNRYKGYIGGFIHGYSR